MHGSYARLPCGMTFLRTSHALSRRTCLRDLPCAGCKAGGFLPQPSHGGAAAA